MKKFVFITFLFLFNIVNIFGLPYDNANEYTFENGLTVFVLEDTYRHEWHVQQLPKPDEP